MDEKKTDEEAPKESATDNSENGDKYETTPVIERARVENERLEKNNAEKRELLDREEAIMAKRALGGESEAGQGAQKPVEESDEDYAKKAISGKFNHLK